MTDKQPSQAAREYYESLGAEAYDYPNNILEAFDAGRWDIFNFVYTRVGAGEEVRAIIPKLRAFIEGKE